MTSDGNNGGDHFDEGPIRRKQLLVATGTTVLSVGFIVWLVAQWGSVCTGDSCWGRGDGSAAPVAMVGLAVGIIGLGLLIMGVLMKAPKQVTLVPDGEVNLSKTRVMLRSGADGDRPTLVVGGRDVQCALGDEIAVGDAAYVVWSIDHDRQWVTLRPVPEPEPDEAVATA